MLSKYLQPSETRGHCICARICAALTAIVFAMGLCSLAAAQPVSDAELLLESIKQAFVDTTLEENINVVSSAFIDSSGRLIESAYFESGTTVRGVRILDYLQGEPARQKTGLDVLPAALQYSAGECRQNASNKYSRTVLFSNQVQLNSGRINNTNAPGLSIALDEALTGALRGSGAWLAVPLDTRLAQLSRYQTLATGLMPFEQADYSIELDFETDEHPATWRQPLRLVRQATDQAAELFRRTVGKNPVVPVFRSAVLKRVDFVYTLRLQDLHTGSLLHSASYRQSLPPRPESLISSDEMEALLPPLQRDLQSFMDEAEGLFNCKVERLNLRLASNADYDSVAQASLRLNIGSLNGAVPGDRFLLSTTTINQPDNVLNSDLVAQLSIGEIVASDLYESQLQIIAGNGSAANLRYAVPF